MTFQTRGGPERIFRLAGSASRSGPKDVTLTLVHTHATEPAEVLIGLKGGEAEHLRHTVLTHGLLNRTTHSIARTPSRPR